MNRKKIVILATALLLLVMAGCGNNEVKPAEGPASETVTQQNPTSTPEKQEEKKEEEKGGYDSELIPWTYKVPGCEIYVSVPNLQEISYGYSQAYLIKKNRIFAVTCDPGHTCDDLAEAHDLAMDSFMASIQDAVFANSLSIVSDSNETINGIDFYKFEGIMDCGHSVHYDAFITGYSFVMEGHPCSIIGMASHDDQSDELIDEIRKTACEMAKSVRTVE